MEKTVKTSKKRKKKGDARFLTFTHKKNSRVLAYILLLINVCVWGASFVIVKPSLTFTTPFRYLFYRFFIASLFGIPIILYYLKKIKFTWRNLAEILALELLGTTISLALLYEGLARTSALESSFITTTGPLFIVLLGVWLLREKEERNEWMGLSIAFLGTLLLLLPTSLNESRLISVSYYGQLLIILQNITIAIYYIAVKKLYKKLPKFFVASMSFIVGLVSFFVLSLAESHFSVGLLMQEIASDLVQPSVQIAAVYMGILGSVIGLTLYIMGQDLIEVSEATLFSYLQPIIYIPLSVIVLGDTVQWRQIVALGLILGGVVLGEWKRKKRKKVK